MKVKYSYLLEQFNVESKKEVDKMKVKYVELSKQATATEILEDIKELLLKTGDFTLGSQVKEFEKKFAKLCQTKYAIGVNSGTDALSLSMEALGIGSGDEVITAPDTFIATVGAIVETGAKPVFVDVADDYNINPELIEKAITKKTKAIVPVHLTGNPADMPKILEIAKKHNLLVVEDACQAVSASIDGKPAGSFGIAGCFSMHPLKNLNVWGDGGVITTDSDDLYKKLLLLRNHGLKTRDEVEIFGYNSRLDTLQAIVANRLMNVLDIITNARIENAKKYDAAFTKLSKYIEVPPRKSNVRQVFHTYVIQVKDRDKLLKSLDKKGIEAKVHYPIPVHLQEAAKYLCYKRGDFPVCEKQIESIITLPVHQHLIPEQIDYVIETVKEFYSGK